MIATVDKNEDWKISYSEFRVGIFQVRLILLNDLWPNRFFLVLLFFYFWSPFSITGAASGDYHQFWRLAVGVPNIGIIKEAKELQEPGA